MATDPSELGRRLRERDRSAAPAALNAIENRADREAAAALLAEVSPAELGGEAPAHLVGVTGPPGAGKSTLLSALVSEWRGRGRDRKSTRLNSSHSQISYAVFCLKKKIN